jgi:hypothetical protein
MAVHKVPQDVEADDKFLGPLSFKQFLFFGGFAICGYLSFLTITKVWPISPIFIMPMFLFGALAFPWSKEQPTELFLASRIRFLIKPRKRIWDQSGVKDLVKVTVPVREAHIYTDGLSQGEVKNRFNALATMVDSRGWAIKNVNANDDSDRLVQPAVAPALNTGYVDSTPDVLDESSGVVAKQFDNMIEKSEQKHKSETLRLVEEARKKASLQNSNDFTETNMQLDNRTPSVNEDKAKSQDFWFMNNNPAVPTDPSLATFQNSTVVAPGAQSSPQSTTAAASNDTTLSEEELLEAVHKKQERDALQTAQHHGKVINPDGTVTDTTKATVKPHEEAMNDIDVTSNKESINTVTPPPDPDILNLAKSNDLNLETLSRQANKKKDLGDDEVVISLH